MKNIKKLSKKTLAIILSVCIMAVSLPLMLLPSFADNISDPRVVDPSTFNSWQTMFPKDDTTQAGRVWTDKSVFTSPDDLGDLVDASGSDYNLSMKDKDKNFLVALSVLASNKSIVGYSYTPTDTMLVLDVSASMNNSGYVDELVASANNAITKLLALNNHNRVGVVLYSGNAYQGNSAGSTAEVLLPLDRYTAPTTGTNRGKFLLDTSNDNSRKVSINGGVKNKAGTVMAQNDKNVSGGTYIQNGVFMAAEEFLAVTDTVIPDGQHQAGTPRTPIFVLMSDGLPTAATNNFAGQNNNRNTVGIGTSNLGDGTEVNDDVLQTAIDFVNQLTASWAAKKVDDKYVDSKPLFYTLGLGKNNQSLSSAVLDPDSFENTDELWKDYVATVNGSNMVIDIEDGNNPDQTSILKIADISSVQQKNYVTKYFPASNEAQLTAAFDAIVNQIIIQSLYYPTLVPSGIHDHDGYVEFVDDIGHYMNVKDMKGIMLGDTFFTGEHLAENFNTDNSKFFNPDGTYTDLGNNVVWSVQERIGIDDVQVARDLINSAYNTYQLRSWNGGWSNYIGWYADDNGNFMGHWHEGHTEADVPEINGVKATYINKSYGLLGAINGEYTNTDLMYISTQVHTRIKDNNVSVIWRIPASLIPVVTYDISLEGDSLDNAENVKINYKAADPIRLIFEVGLSEELNAVNLNDKVEDKAAHILDENKDGISDDGKYYFYTNWWNDDNLTHINPNNTQDTLVFFAPSVQNERYYYAEETAVYINNGTDTNPDYVLYKGAMPIKTDGKDYYRRYAVFKGTGSEVDGIIPAEIEWKFEIISDTTLDTLTESCKNTDNSWDIPSGTVHRVLEPYNIEKTENKTGSLKYSLYPTLQTKSTHNHIHIGAFLGNNGVLTVDIPQGIKLTKTVDDSLFGTNDYFTFELDSNGFDLTGATFYHEDVNGVLNEIVPTISGGKPVVKIKANESVYVLGIDSGTAIAIKEEINGNYKVSKITVNGSALPLAVNDMSTTIVADKLTEVEFENTLVVNDGTIVISKEVNHDSGIPYNNAHEFEFEVYPVGNYAARQTFKIKAGDSYTLTGLAPGDYIVNEIEANLPDGFAPQQNLVTVTADNNIVATAHFINDYTPTAVKPALVVSGTKTLNGRAWQSGDEFEFALEIQEGTEWHAVGNTRKVSVNTVKDYVFDFANDADLQNFEFDKVGTYWLRVREVIPVNKLGGVTYDEYYRYFSVVVTDATMDGKLEVSAVNAVTPATVTNTSSKYTVDIDFTNTYAPTGADELIVTIDKNVDDKVGAQKGKDGYVFGIFTENGTTPIVTTAPTDANGKTSFDLSFPATTVGNVYHFKVKEIVPEDKLLGMDYDPKVYDLTIKIVDNLDGTISAVVDLGTTTSDTTNFSFTNVYNPDAVEVTLSGKKQLEGRGLTANEFTFELFEDGNTTAIDTATNDANGIFTFGKLTFDQIGTYKYTVKEQKGNLGGITYDTRMYTVKVVVTDDADNDGALDYKVYINDNETQENAIQSKLLFVNVYAADEATVVFKATKKLAGRDIIDGEFKFDLYKANDDFSLGAIIDDDMVIAKVDAKTGIVSFTIQTFGTAGTYKFVILEDETNEKGITVDTHRYQITVIVTDDGNGNLVAEVKVDGATINGGMENAVVFNNSYTVDPTDIFIEAEKHLNGAELKGNDFTFVLYDKDGNLIEKVQNDKGGKVVFSKLNITVAGTYVYTIKELNENAKGITYDETEYTVTVNVKDGGEGLFEVDIVYSDAEGEGEKAVFENTFTPQIPQTSDSTNAVIWFMLMVISGGLALALAIFRKKQNN
ncbi:MAG: VWA domain-containing protein [Clostridia bacterium]|nr:VWA domain-containing protein [Clostridia bacterium]